MADKYANFAALAHGELPQSYSIRVRNLGSRIAVVAPHGGAIEPGTSEVACAIAGDDLSYYVFEGLKSKANTDLHITSTSFDEPQCLQLVTAASVVVAVHGEASDEPVVFLGGRNTACMSAVQSALAAAGFVTGNHTNVALQGRDPSNIVNRGLCGAGVQLELSRGLRKQLFASLESGGRAQPTPKLMVFARAVRDGMCKSGI